MSEAVALTTSVSFNQNQYEIRKMRAEIAGGYVDIQGHGVLQGAASLEFHAADIHPEAFLRDRPVSGVIAADGTASLTGPSLQGASGEASVSRFELLVRDTEIHQTEPVRVSLKNDVLSVDSFHIDGADTNAAIHGTVGLPS